MSTAFSSVVRHRNSWRCSTFKLLMSPRAVIVSLSGKSPIIVALALKKTKYMRLFLSGLSIKVLVYPGINVFNLSDLAAHPKISFMKTSSCLLN